MSNSSSGTKRLYWIFTLLFALPLLASGVGFCIGPAPVMQGMAHLGYPVYIIRFLGVAKIMGAAAVLLGTFPKIKDWAYAGFTFLLLGAAYSHLCSSEVPKALSPLVVLVFAGLSYYFWHKLQKHQRVVT